MNRHAKEIAQHVWDHLPECPPLEGREQMFAGFVLAAEMALDAAAGVVRSTPVAMIDDNYDSLERAASRVLLLKKDPTTS